MHSRCGCRLHDVGHRRPMRLSYQVPLSADAMTHRYVVHISDTGLLAQRARSATDFTADGRVIPPNGTGHVTSDAGAGSGGAGGRNGVLPGRRSSHLFRFDCELGDVWSDVTGVDRISNLMTSLLDGMMTPRRPHRKAMTNAQQPSEAAVNETESY